MKKHYLKLMPLQNQLQLNYLNQTDFAGLQPLMTLVSEPSLLSIKQ